MKIYNDKNRDRFSEITATVRQNLDAWRLVRIFSSHQQDTDSIVGRLALTVDESMAGNDGVAFKLNDREMIAFLHTGIDYDTQTLRDRISRCLMGYNYKITAESPSAHSLDTIDVMLKALAPKDIAPEKAEHMRRLRQSRSQKVLLVVDDDSFTRLMLNKALADYGMVVEMSSGDGFSESYLELAPDVVFLDIHLPGKTGFDLLSEINGMDADACVVMISGDSVKDNVLVSRAGGAKSFLTKPFTRSRVVEALSRCPPFQQYRIS